MMGRVDDFFGVINSSHIIFFSGFVNFWALVYKSEKPKSVYSKEKN